MAVSELRGPARYGPFLVLLSIGLILPAFAVGSGVHPAWWAAAAVLVVGMPALFWLADRHRGLAWLSFPTALLSFPAIVLLELADPRHATAYVPLLIVPVLWSALYEDVERLAATLVLTAIALVLPVVLIGAPDYPISTWRTSLLWMVVLAVLAPVISTLVAARRRATDRLQADESLYRTAFSDSPAPIAIVGVEGNEQGRILRANHPLEVLIGCPHGGLVGRSVTEFAYPEDVAALAKMVAEADSFRVRNAELRLRQTSGRIRWVAASVAVVRQVDEPLRCVCHFQDITVRHESEHALLEALEQQGQAANQLAEVAQARSDLVAAVSHDVRTPLATIGAYVQLLESGDAGELTDDQRAMVDVIEENLRRTYAITDDLLALGRMERASAEKPDTAVCIGEVIEQAVRSIEPSTRVRRQQVRMDLQLGTARVAGHEGQLDRAISNLLTNAVKFTPEGGTISVRGKVDGVDRAGRVDGASVVITVSDTGVGIAPEEQEKIFQRFYRSDSVRGRRVSGTGLGLAIAQEIATLHGGTITVESTPGKGATFTLILPVLAAG